MTSTGDKYFIHRVHDDKKVYECTKRKDAVAMSQKIHREDGIRTYVVDFKGEEIYSHKNT